MERISRALELARAQRDARETERSREQSNEAAESSRAADGPVPEIVSIRPSTALRTISLESERRDEQHIVACGCGGIAGAPYKMLRTQVLQRLDQLGANTLAILSSATGAGKTLTAINLAIAIAADVGRTALLVDFDLRSPSIHERLGFVPQVGIDDCLQDGKPLSDAMCALDGYERLRILPARARVENSSELLRSKRTVELLIEMRTRYADRIVIFDLPPVLQADDALALSRFMQAGLLVVGEGRTRRDDAVRCVELLRELTIVGTVLNGSRAAGTQHY